MSATDSNLSYALREALDDYHRGNLHQQETRRFILSIAPRLLAEKNTLWLGKENIYYIGPDVDNKNLIFIWGPKANHPLHQMQTDGKRSSVRRPRVKKRTNKKSKNK